MVPALCPPQLDDAMAMWADLHKFDESIELAYARNHPEAWFAT